jgi:short-subunit dehydrogenase
MGVVWGIKAFVPRMLEAGEEGVVLATTSGAGTDGTTYTGNAYAATKNAVLSVMECLYGQLRDKQSLVRAGLVFPPLTATNLAGDGADMKLVEGMLNSRGVPAVLIQPEQVAELVLDGVERGRFFIRIGREENERIFGGALSDEYFAWNEAMIRGRAEAQLGDGAPDSYLW